MYSLTSSEGHESKVSFTGVQSRCWQGWFLLRDPGKSLFIASFSFWWLTAFLGLWPHPSNRCLVFTLPCPFDSQIFLWFQSRPTQIVQWAMATVTVLPAMATINSSSGPRPLQHPSFFEMLVIEVQIKLA